MVAELDPTDRGAVVEELAIVLEAKDVSATPNGASITNIDPRATHEPAHRVVDVTTDLRRRVSTRTWDRAVLRLWTRTGQDGEDGDSGDTPRQLCASRPHAPAV